MKIIYSIILVIQLSILVIGCDNEKIDPALIATSQNQEGDPTCPSPTNMAASNFVGTTINLTWTAKDEESSWQIEYGIFGFNQGSGTKRVATINSVSIPNLQSDKKYSFYIRSICGNQSFGNWIGPVTVDPN